MEGDLGGVDLVVEAQGYEHFVHGLDGDEVLPIRQFLEPSEKSTRLLLVVVHHVLFPPFQHPVSSLRIRLIYVTVGYGLML